MNENKFPTLLTEYVERMDKNTPWNEYPRPSMERGSFLCLNGYWDFAISTEEKTDIFTDKILVPFPPESLLSGLEKEVPEGCFMHYRRCFSSPDIRDGERALLHFGAVDTICDVYLNGRHICHHEGGYLPFKADITDVLSNGENILYLVVRDDLSGDYTYGKQKRNRGGMWYTPVSGIWQTVWVEVVPERYIEKLKIATDLKSVRITVIGGDDHKKVTLDSGEIIEFDGESVEFTPESINLWSPENPFIYRFTLECGKDKVRSYFALREIGSTKINGIPRLTLNGKPYLFNGLLDQGYYPDGIFLPATSDGYRDDILRCKEHGFNLLRKHIKIEPEIFYHLCDTLGMVVFQDMVNNSAYSFFFDTALPTIGFKSMPEKRRSKKAKEIFESEMYGTIDHLYSFPSVLYYTIFNEGWGQFSADEMYVKAKKYDPTRIYDATSGWFKKKKSDVDSRHVYFKKIRLGKVGERPVVISEFGGYSHRVDGHLFGKNNYGYSIFAKQEDFENAFVKLYESEVMPLISIGISALVYTQVSDVEDETNGILTYDRKVEKLNKSKIHSLMARLSDEINK